MSEKVLVKDIFDFSGLLEKYPGRRIKFRFNKNFYRDKDKKEGYFDFVEHYQSQSDLFSPYLLSMHKSRNRADDIQFQFIEVESHKWLFVGAYLILERDSQIQRDWGDWDMKFALAQRLTEFDKYSEKLLLDWKNRGQCFFYVDRNIIDNIEVCNLSSTPYFTRNIDFPGYENLSVSYSELKQHIYSSSWCEHLSSVYGVYVITDIKTGKLYVGSAYGDSGIYGRWATYLSDGYDKTEVEDSQYPNAKLRELVNKKGLDYIKNHFQYTLLEIFSKTETGKSKALERENYWKKVLQSRKFGYNRN